MSKKKTSIHVGILEARGLAPTNFFGTADTYCVLTLDADSKQLKDQTAPRITLLRRGLKVFRKQLEGMFTAADFDEDGVLDLRTR